MVRRVSKIPVFCCSLTKKEKERRNKKARAKQLTKVERYEAEGKKECEICT